MEKSFNINKTPKTKTIKKPPSGYELSRSTEEADKFAVSAKMRTQIMAFERVVQNKEDSISIIKTFSDATSQTLSFLQEMRDMAEKSATAPYYDDEDDDFNILSYGENEEYDEEIETEEEIEEIDRKALMLDFVQKATELNKIADADYKGIIMLNGGRMSDGRTIDDNGIIRPDPRSRRYNPETEIGFISAPKTVKAKSRGFIFSETLLLQSEKTDGEPINYFLANITGDGMDFAAKVVQDANFFRLVYGGWLVDVLKRIFEKTGLQITENIPLNLNFEYRDNETAAKINSLIGMGYDQTLSLMFNLKYIDKNGNFIKIDKPESFSTVELYIERILNAELLRALIRLNTQITDIPIWYSEGLSEFAFDYCKYTQTVEIYGSSDVHYVAVLLCLCDDVTYESINADIQAMTSNSKDKTAYPASGLFVRWLNNHATSGVFNTYSETPSENTGGIKTLSNSLKDKVRAGFDMAMEETFGTAAAVLLEQFKAESAQAAELSSDDDYSPYLNWLNEKLNLHIDDLPFDDDANDDDIEIVTDNVIRNDKPLCGVDIISDVKKLHNGKKITLIWNTKSVLLKSHFLDVISDEETRHITSAFVLSDSLLAPIGDLRPDLDCSVWGLGITDYRGNLAMQIDTPMNANYALEHLDYAINKILRIQKIYSVVQKQFETKVAKLKLSGGTDARINTQISGYGGKTIRESITQASLAVLYQAEHIQEYIEQWLENQK